jgi:hypothetical protein
MRGHLRYLLTVALSVLVVASLAAVHPDQPEAAPGAGLPNGFGRAVFLSHVNDPDSVSLFPGDPEFVIEQVASVEADGFYMNKVSEGEHTGTHFSAPCHFHDGERCADQLAARDFFFPAVVIDVRTAARANADYAISVGDVKAFERRHGRIPAGAAVIAWTGWQDKWARPPPAGNQLRPVRPREVAGRYGRLDLLSLDRLTRSARKSSQVRWPTACSGARFAPARTARAALPGNRTGTMGRCRRAACR